MGCAVALPLAKKYIFSTPFTLPDATTTQRRRAINGAMRTPTGTCATVWPHTSTTCDLFHSSSNPCAPMAGLVSKYVAVDAIIASSVGPLDGCGNRGDAAEARC